MAISGCHVMAKPTGSVCNIDCRYCFYLEKEALYPERQQHWKMSDETLNKYIRQHIAAQKSEQVVFAWQGGEKKVTVISVLVFQKSNVPLSGERPNKSC